MPTTPAPRPLKITHYATWDAYGRRVVQAVCGAFIRRTESDRAPTCDRCRELIARLDELQP